MEFEGEVLMFLVMSIPAAVWKPDLIAKLAGKNPFKEEEPESEAMKAHKAKIAEMRFKAMTGGA